MAGGAAMTSQAVPATVTRNKFTVAHQTNRKVPVQYGRINHVVRAQATSTDDPFKGLPSDCSFDEGGSYEESSFRPVALGGRRKIHPLTQKMYDQRDAAIKAEPRVKNRF